MKLACVCVWGGGGQLVHTLPVFLRLESVKGLIRETGWLVFVFPSPRSPVFIFFLPSCQLVSAGGEAGGDVGVWFRVCVFVCVCFCVFLPSESKF